jgi:uncharacterized membrane protein YjjP (DUF1212 family)
MGEGHDPLPHRYQWRRVSGHRRYAGSGGSRVRRNAEHRTDRKIAPHALSSRVAPRHLYAMTEPVRDGSDGVAVDLLARLGAALIAANAAMGLVRQILTSACRRYGLTSQFLLLPDYIQFVGFDRAAGTIVRVLRVDRELRFDQTFMLGELVGRVEQGKIGAKDGAAELDRIVRKRPRFPAWVSVTGYATQCVGAALILRSTPLALMAATVLGLLVGALGRLGRLSVAAEQLLPTFSAFLVALTVFTLGRHWQLGQDALQALVSALGLFLPGVAMTLATIELTMGEAASGSSRLTAGFTRLAQLAFGIFVAAQVAGVTLSDLTLESANKLGWWAPWAGVAVYAVGVMLYSGPPLWFLPWLLAILFITYSSQLAAGAVFGGYASGFGGGLALMVCGQILSRRPHSPPTAALITPGFWLLVPGSIALIGIAALAANSYSAITVTLASMLSIALGMQTGLLLWRSFPQLRSAVRRKHPRDSR